jgi:PST family polysaccharide transporter
VEADKGNGGLSSDAASDDPDGLIPASTRTVSSAVGWSFVTNTTRLLSTLGTAFLLASLLGPDAFGTVALAVIFVSLVQLLIQQGITPAIVQHRGLTWRHVDSAFWLSVTVSIGLTVVSFVVSPWWARVNGTPDAKDAIRVLSALILIKGAVVVHEGLLQRDLRFRELALRTTIASVAGAVVGITWAIVHPSIWALVAQQLVSASVGAAVIWTVTPWRPKLVWRVREARDLAGFTAKSTLSSLGVFVNTRVDAVLIGLYFGATAIGLYQLSFRMMQSAIEAAVYPIAGVALADLSRYQGDRVAVGDRYRAMVGVSTSVGAPVMAVIFACAHPLMATVGDEWTPAAPALQLLCVVGVVTTIGLVNSPALQAAGRPGAQATLVWVGALVSAVTFAIVGALLTGRTTGAQVVGMAASRAVVYVVVLLPISQAVLITKYVGVRPGQFLRVVMPPLAASCAAAVAGLALENVLSSAGVPSPLVLLAVGSLTLAAVVPLVLFSSPYARLMATRVLERAPGRVVPDQVTQWIATRAAAGRR